MIPDPGIQHLFNSNAAHSAAPVAPETAGRQTAGRQTIAQNWSIDA